MTTLCSLILAAAFVAPPPAPPPMRVQVTPEFAIDVRVDAGASDALARALLIPAEQLAVLRSILDDAAAAQQEFDKKGNDRLHEAGAAEGEKLLRDWFDRYAKVTKDSDPGLYEEGQQANAQLNARLEELKKPIEQERLRLHRESDGALRDVVEKLAAVSPLEPDVARDRARLELLRPTFLQFSSDTWFGDFQRPIDVRQFIAFAAHVEPKLAPLFGLQNNADAFAAAERTLGAALTQYDSALLAYLNERLARRRNSAPKDTSALSSKVALAWTRQYELARGAVDQLRQEIARTSPELGERWFSLYQEYLCPDLTGRWAADESADVIAKHQPALPAEQLAALTSIMDGFNRERVRLVNEAFDLGIAAARKTGSAKRSASSTATPEQTAYAERVAQIKDASARAVDAILSLVKNDKRYGTLEAELTAMKVRVRDAGGDPFIREHMTRFANVHH